MNTYAAPPEKITYRESLALRRSGSAPAMPVTRPSCDAAPPAAPGPPPPSPSRGGVGRMDLAAFIAGDRVVRIHSTVLGEDVLLAGEKGDVGLWHFSHPDAAPALPVYRGEELRAVLEQGVSPFLRDVLSVFGGRLLRESEPGGPYPTASKSTKQVNAKGKKQ